ncbi:OB-fold nucleic acid binding domain-containing protein [Colletotrichum nymphaeae SA-01]|uniref:OB-fold nucleic acid binding domain-containing protein n=1 Tax=Colletotrichum nymphaeae SA-01 TaxID=1460502 RepID=A0A135T9I7_9PEZI|nr:OB-fold nucleic acid binding domain-containing protein [Colletotrichum nymphaeae SA-01]
MQASDVHALKTVPEYEVQNFYFYKNLPIKWARIVGIVVAVDDFPGRRIYTVDDSSGACIECTVATKTPPADKNVEANEWFTKRPQPQPPADCVDVDVGTVIDIKGGLTMFREEMQIKIEKVKILRSTEEEVALWEKRTRFRNEVLQPPWVLSERQIRKCRKEGMRDAESEERRRKRERRREERKKEEEEMRRKTEAAEAAAAQENRYHAYKLKKGVGSRPMVQTSQALTAVPTTAASAPIVEDQYRAYKLRKGDGSRPIAHAGQVIVAVPTEATAAPAVEDRFRAYSLKRGHSTQEQQSQRIARPAPVPAAEDPYTAYKIKKGGDSRPAIRPDATAIDTAAAEAVEDRYRIYKFTAASQVRSLKFAKMAPRIPPRSYCLVTGLRSWLHREEATSRLQCVSKWHLLTTVVNLSSTSALATMACSCSYHPDPAAQKSAMPLLLRHRPECLAKGKERDDEMPLHGFGPWRWKTFSLPNGSQLYVHTIVFEAK